MSAAASPVCVLLFERHGQVCLTISIQEHPLIKVSFAEHDSLVRISQVTPGQMGQGKHLSKSFYYARYHQFFLIASKG